MPSERRDGDAQPGIAWGPFTLRIPFVHTGFEAPEFLQGVLVSAATGLALVPLMTAQFGLGFEEAVLMSIISGFLVASGPIIFGEPFAPGWITPALPLVLNFVLSEQFPTPTAKFQMMTALALSLAAILIVMGVTGLGKRLIDALPPALTGALIMGAAIAAIKRVLVDDAPDNLLKLPVSIGLAITLCLVLAFSVPMQRWRQQIPWLNYVASLGLLPGFLVAGIIGALIGELSWIDPATGQSTIRWEIMSLPLESLSAQVSPFRIGFPSLSMFIEALPLAFIAYVILFGDIVTGIEVLRSAARSRPDERIDFDATRSHLSVGIRNFFMGLTAPFFPTQGALWTGVHVIIVNRWSLGRDQMNSLHSGIASYYTFGPPVLLFLLPITTGLQPMFPIALALTLMLTGFACAYVAMDIPTTPAERGVVMLGGAAIAFFPPLPGLVTAALATYLILGGPARSAQTAGDASGQRTSGPSPDALPHTVSESG